MKFHQIIRNEHQANINDLQEAINFRLGKLRKLKGHLFQATEQL
jgi:hypothetical protein